MKDPREYDCLGRYTGKCTRFCTRDSANFLCSDFYPCHPGLGGAVIEPRDRAEVLMARLRAYAEQQAAPGQQARASSDGLSWGVFAVA